MLSGKRRHNYDVSFRRSVKQVTADKLPAKVAIAETGDMIDRYLEDTGEIPSENYLERMADAILSEELTDNGAHKSRRSEYPFLSEHQLRNRKKHDVELDADVVDAVYSKYVDPTVYPAPAVEFSERTTDRKSMRTDVPQSWAMVVKERDGFRCQRPDCRSRNGIMHAHHIQNYADHPELREETTNGVTLCESCHIEFHGYYGKRRTNSEQLREFFGNNLLNA